MSGLRERRASASNFYVNVKFWVRIPGRGGARAVVVSVLGRSPRPAEDEDDGTDQDEDDRPDRAEEDAVAAPALVRGHELHRERLVAGDGPARDPHERVGRGR
jgi:hypothetical protein